LVFSIPSDSVGYGFVFEGYRMEPSFFEEQWKGWVPKKNIKLGKYHEKKGVPGPGNDHISPRL